MFERAAATCLVAGGILAAAVGTPSAAIDPAGLLRAAEAARALPEEGRLRLRVVSLDGERRRDDAQIDVYVANGERWLAIFRSGKQAGRRILAADGQTWLVVPEARRAVPVGAEHRGAGAAVIADLVRLDLRSTYDVAGDAADGEIEDLPCRVLDLRARTANAPFPTARLWLAGADALPRRLELRLASGRPAQRVDFVRYRAAAGGRSRLERMDVTDLLRRGQRARTLVELLEHHPGAVDHAWFTPEGARTAP